MVNTQESPKNRTEMIRTLVENGHDSNHIREVLSLMTESGCFKKGPSESLTQESHSNGSETTETVPSTTSLKKQGWKDYVPFYHYRSKKSKFNIRAFVLGFYKSNPETNVVLCHEALALVNPALRVDQVMTACVTLCHEKRLLSCFRPGTYKLP